MSYTILLFKDNHMRFDEYDLIVASLLILNVNNAAVELHFPKMKNIWLENFATSGNGCADLYLEDFLTKIELEDEFLEIVENTYKYVESNTHDNIFDLSSVYNLVSTTPLSTSKVIEKRRAPH